MYLSILAKIFFFPDNITGPPGWLATEAQLEEAASILAYQLDQDPFIRTSVNNLNNKLIGM